jgi:integrase
MTMPNLSKVADRAKLKPRPHVYWQKLSRGCYLGFRKTTATSDGTWLARAYDEATGERPQKSIGDFSRHPPHARFDMAKAEAETWFAHLGKGGETEAATVRKACERYVAHLSKEGRSKAADDAKARFARYVYSDTKFASIQLDKLKPTHVDEWRKALRQTPTRGGARKGQSRSDSALNRDMTALRAALNLAYADGYTTSDFAWRSKLTPVKNADGRRDVYLDLGQRRKLLGEAPADLANLIRGLCLLPLRPGALAALTVADFDERLATLRIGKDKAGKDRRISLPQATKEFFAAMSRDKLPGAPLISRSDGRAWNKDAWKHPIKSAASATKLPAGASCYSIRHSVITDLIHGGLDTLTVAQLAGTSVLMIEKHYGHLTQEQARKALALLAI